jgi:hypothetical protein
MVIRRQIIAARRVCEKRQLQGRIAADVKFLHGCPPAILILLPVIFTESEIKKEK